MLNVEVVMAEDFDAANNEFIQDIFDLRLEHSLLSLSKWEAFFEKPFLGEGEKSREEFVAYIQAMMLDSRVPENLFEKLTDENILEITKYIASKQSATTISETPGAGRSEIITSELIYYWLVAYQIPFSPTETWHLNRVLNLVRICAIKNQKPKQMSRQEIARRNKQLNDERRQKYNTKG